MVDCETCFYEPKSPQSMICRTCGIAMKNYAPKTPKYDQNEFFSAERSGCIPCPARETCFATYRGSICAARRSKYGLGDPKTNFDAIHAMNIEELADKIHGLEFDAYTHASTIHSAAWWLDWLKSSAEDAT